jgi:hypothetical protein
VAADVSADSGQQQSGPQPDPLAWTGPWADDARRLFRVLQGALDEAAPESAHSAECTYCPICRGVAVLRRAGPDVLDRVSDLAAGLAATLRTLEDEPGPEPGTWSADSAAPDPAPPPSTVRIDITD